MDADTELGEGMHSCPGVECMPSLVIQMYLTPLLFLLMMTKIALLNSTAFLPGMKSIKKKRKTVVFVFYAEETSCIGSSAERRNLTVGCSGSTYSAETNKEGEHQKAEDRWVSRTSHVIKGFIRN